MLTYIVLDVIFRHAQDLQTILDLRKVSLNTKTKRYTMDTKVCIAGRHFRSIHATMEEGFAVYLYFIE